MNFSHRPRLSYANVIATIALFIALGGAAVAAGLPRNSVGPRQLKRGAVTARALGRDAVNSGKIAPKSVIVGKLGPSAVLPGNIVNGGVSSEKLALNAVIAKSIKNGVVTASKLANEAVTAAKLGKGSVTAGKLADDIAPLLGTLKTGQTLRGSFDLGGDADAARAGQSFQFPLLNPPAAPEANVLAADASSTACPGLKGTNQQTPEAAAGQLCVYVKSSSANFQKLSFDGTSVNRLGFGLLATFTAADEGNLAQGFWAVSAP
jgi:hypothetical protein